MTVGFSTIFIVLGLFHIVSAQTFYVVAPHVFRLGANETVGVVFEGNNRERINLYIQDYPGKVRNISEAKFIAHPGIPELIPVELQPLNFTENFFLESEKQKLVSLNVVSRNFRKEIVIPVTSKSGYVFIQTDKPLYKPNERAQIRIIPLNEEERPSKNPFKLQIKNTNGFIVEEKLYNPQTQKLKNFFTTHIYTFPEYADLGEWSASVLYGFKFEQNSTVHFTVKKYVLPTFTVELKTPDVILPSSQYINGSITATHVYGKKVDGYVTIRLGVARKGTSTVTYLAVIGTRKLRHGTYRLNVKIDDLKEAGLGWFPEIEGTYLVVEATVVDEATTNRVTVADAKCRFSISPFVISFKRCLKDFRPGLVSIFEADINYVDGRPASNVPIIIEAKADGQLMNILHNSITSDENGKVSFHIHPEMKHEVISVKIETNDPRFGTNQAKDTFVQRKYRSGKEAYIAIERNTAQRLQPGDTFSKTIHFHPDELKDFYYVVVAKGKILVMNKLTEGAFKAQNLKFKITHEMVPSFRIVVFTHYRGELVADSLKIDVERVCSPDSQVTVMPDFNVKEPGSSGEIIIRGSSGTLVGLLGVDEAVFAMSKKDLLTKTKIFNRIADHDLGCGPGGGVDIHYVLRNAGLVMGTNHFTPSESRSCDELRRRRKREINMEIANSYPIFERMCCIKGLEQDVIKTNCKNATEEFILKDEYGMYPKCSDAFTKCCRHKEIISHGGRVNQGKADEIDSDENSEEEFPEKELLVRSDFRETWINTDINIGSDGSEKHLTNLPHSITTWVIQAVALSEKHGICVIEPEKVKSFKKIFIQLNLPYSVVRREQIEIRATVFNYGNEAVTAIVYMYGAKDLCSNAQPGERSKNQRIRINSQSAQTVTFPVVPLNAVDIPIKVVARTKDGSDVVEKLLHVVPEGKTKEFDISVELDPTNLRRREKRHLNTEYFSDTIDPDQKLQVTAVKLSAPERYVPGSVICSLSAVGDQLGAAVQTSINNPEKLLQQPRGCGEQNMMFMAPTLYTMKYLKFTGKLTQDKEEKASNYLRLGYGNQLAYRKKDGAYAAFPDRAPSTWLTAFVVKVFCQASEYVYIEEKVICSAVEWLLAKQKADGSFVEHNPVYHKDMVGGVNGEIPMTAFTLIALQECKCDVQDLHLAKMRALSQLEEKMGEVQDALPAAIVTYALALSNSEKKETANERLLLMSVFDEENNMRHWTSKNAAQDIEAAGYALLAQLLLNNMDESMSIVNWLNTKQLQSGSFKSTQDTVVALQSLSAYAIRSQLPIVDLTANVSVSNDGSFQKILKFNKDNALVVQDMKVNKVGGTLFIYTTGNGVGKLVVKFRYNSIVPKEEICKFDITVDTTETIKRNNPEDIGINPRINGNIDINNEHIVGVPKVPDEKPEEKENPVENAKMMYAISICVRHLGQEDAGMSIVDVGIFSGFQSDTENLQQLVTNSDAPNSLIERYEKTSRGVLFYLKKVPIKDKYCFSFDVTREYVVGETQPSVVKVYDYYNPDEACSEFYGPPSTSSILKTLCIGEICQCAEGGCPPKNPFLEITALNNTRDRRRALEVMACEKYDYVWRGKLEGQMVQEDNYLNIPFKILKVVKGGIERASLIENKIRILQTRTNCTTATLTADDMYLIMGKDGEIIETNNKEKRRQYILDKTSVVYLWTSPREAVNKDLQLELNHATRRLESGGCNS